MKFFGCHCLGGPLGACGGMWEGSMWFPVLRGVKGPRTKLSPRGRLGVLAETTLVASCVFITSPCPCSCPGVLPPDPCNYTASPRMVGSHFLASRGFKG